jgi:hypothetical protein
LRAGPITQEESALPLKLIRLELARTKDFPDGSHKHGYEFTAPLAEDGHLDPEGWKSYGQACTVLRFWGDDEVDEHGQLVRTRGGNWAFSYEPGDDDDEPIFRFDSHRFEEGEYITITEHDGVARPFRIVWVRTPPEMKPE